MFNSWGFLPTAPQRSISYFIQSSTSIFKYTAKGAGIVRLYVEYLAITREKRLFSPFQGLFQRLLVQLSSKTTENYWISILHKLANLFIFNLGHVRTIFDDCSDETKFLFLWEIFYIFLYKKYFL